MRILTRAECEIWCCEHGVALRHSGWARPDFASSQFHRVKLPYEADSGHKVWLANLLYSLTPPAPETLLWIQDFEVWPSSQHLPLFTRFREGLGESRSLYDAPGHLVGVSDIDDAVSIIATSLLFLWDCYGIASSGRDAFYVSHDEFCWFVTRDEELATRIMAVSSEIALTQPSNQAVQRTAGRSEF